MFELRDGSCFPRVLAAVNVVLACIDGVVALLAFSQLIRIHSRSRQLGWTRQKVFHLIIGSSNVGYFLYFVLTLVATCKGWLCWSNSCGFVLMACPKILLLAAFLLLLSFWVDLCHQPDDEDDEDEESSSQEALLEKTLNLPSSSNKNSHRKCCSLRAIHIGSRQKIVILVYVDLFSIAILLLGGALACYGLMLCLKMRKVRSERASSEMSKVAGLAVVSVICFTSSAFVALFTDIPMLYHWHPQPVNGVSTSLLLILYYFIGSSVPSAFVLWVMRELPPSITTVIYVESRPVTFISDSSESVNHPQRWSTATSSQNQISRASPI
ncbi:tobamovirus multiplication protein 1 isoform X2 [Vitis vinifera]|uniref:tobamovirus multiplication protein 1 isoform X2 n=1 Tax=Vitis vinifera TaxID=29760 RepID=UPI0008FED2BA|nr:tobamovirus multiplication protein 1 isoform X2 [Vitis vinifera]|eukprot:XP_019078243.1 PREDICTED: tobamovirus multiplication protein 1 isoform X3 [Vitis vinifera]